VDPDEPDAVFARLTGGESVTPSSLPLDDPAAVRRDLERGRSAVLHAGSFAAAADAVRAFAPLGVDAMVAGADRVDRDPDLLVVHHEEVHGLARAGDATARRGERAVSEAVERLEAADADAREVATALRAGLAGTYPEVEVSVRDDRRGTVADGGHQRAEAPDHDRPSDVSYTAGYSTTTVALAATLALALLGLVVAAVALQFGLL